MKWVGSGDVAASKALTGSRFSVEQFTAKTLCCEYFNSLNYFATTGIQLSGVIYD